MQFYFFALKIRAQLPFTHFLTILCYYSDLTIKSLWYRASPTESGPVVSFLSIRYAPCGEFVDSCALGGDSTWSLSKRIRRSDSGGRLILEQSVPADFRNCAGIQYASHLNYLCILIMFLSILLIPSHSLWRMTWLCKESSFACKMEQRKKDLIILLVLDHIVLEVSAVCHSHAYPARVLIVAQFFA